MGWDSDSAFSVVLFMVHHKLRLGPEIWASASGRRCIGLWSRERFIVIKRLIHLMHHPTVGRDRPRSHQHSSTPLVQPLTSLAHTWRRSVVSDPSACHFWGNKVWVWSETGRSRIREERCSTRSPMSSSSHARRPGHKGPTCTEVMYKWGTAPSVRLAPASAWLPFSRLERKRARCPRSRTRDLPRPSSAVCWMSGLPGRHVDSSP